MKRGAAVLAIGATLLAAAPAVADAVPATPRLTINSTGTAAVLWSVTKPVTLSLDTLSGGMKVTGGRTYVGLAVHDDDGRLLAAAAHPRTFTFGDQPLLVWLGPARPALQLQAGTYRITVIADAPATISIGAKGAAANVRLRATKPARGVTAAAFSMNASGPLTVTGNTDLSAAAGSTYGVFTYHRTSAPSADVSWFCLRPPSSACSADDNDFRTSGAQLSREGEYTSTSALWAPDSPPGRFTAGAGSTTAATAATASGFAMSVPNA